MRVRALSSTGDYTFGQGQANFLVNSPAAVGQLVGTTLKLWQGEWFLDTQFGTPWMQEILGSFSMKNIVDMILQSVILGTQPRGCVTRIISYSSTLSAQRGLSVVCTIATQFSDDQGNNQVTIGVSI